MSWRRARSEGAPAGEGRFWRTGSPASRTWTPSRATATAPRRHARRRSRRATRRTPRSALADAELALTVVRAPFSGVIADCSTEVGEWITPAPPGVPIPAVLDLIDPGSVYVSAPIDEVDSQRVRVGQEVRVTVDSLPGQKLRGQADPGGAVRPRRPGAEPHGRDRGGSPGREDGRRPCCPVRRPTWRSSSRAAKGCCASPPRPSPRAGRCWCSRADRLEERTISTGMRNWQFTEVKGGVSVGELVVTARDSPTSSRGHGRRAREAAVIELEEVWRIYRVGEGEVHALSDVSLTIERGEHVALMGPSGSGKSTLLHILGCLDRPTRGRYLLEGREVGALSEEERSLLRRHRIGFVFQFFHLLPRLSALGNVELPMLFAGVAPERAPRARGPGAEGRGALPPRGAPARPALRRRAPAGGDRAGGGDGPRGPAGRRADRQPRPRLGGRGDGAARGDERDAG